MLKSRSKSLIATLLAGSMLSACGGGGSNNDGDAAAPAPVAAAPAPVPATKAEGVYEGTASGNQTFQALILDNDQFWSLYGTMSGSTFLVAGFIQGQGASSAGTYTSPDLKDFGYFPPVAGTLNSTYVAGTSLSGTITSAGGTQSFAGAAMPATDYSFATAASVSSIVGPWTMDVLNGSSAQLSIAASGAFSGTTGEQCRFSGTIVPHSSGKNVFALSVVFGAAPCVNPNQPAAGIAVTYLVDGGPKRQLIMLGVNSARTDGAGLIGTR